MMKEWVEYRTKVEYPSRTQKRNELTDAINKMPLTTKERNERLADVARLVSEWFAEAVIPHRDDEKRLLGEFWYDCRDSLGYEKFLKPDGVKALEAMAWENGHSSGFSEVYGSLVELSELAEVLVKNEKSE